MLFDGFGSSCILSNERIYRKVKSTTNNIMEAPIAEVEEGASAPSAADAQGTVASGAEVPESAELLDQPSSEPASRSTSASPTPPSNGATTTTRQTSKKGGRGGRSLSPVFDTATMAAVQQAVPILTDMGFHGVATLLGTSSAALVLTPSSSASSTVASFGSAAAGTATLATATHSKGSQAATSVASATELVQTAASKAIQDVPPWIHWSKIDTAPQLKILDPAHRLQLKSNRGYRMSRANVGVSPSSAVSTHNPNTAATPSFLTCFYYECWILPGPSAHEIWQSLPPNARLGAGLQKQLDRALAWEEQHGYQDGSGGTAKKRTHEAMNEEDDDGSDTQGPPSFGGHVRLGWSMRTGDLQAPVGYDKWSYAIRDINGSILHQSQRDDSWNDGEGFTVGDVVGCAIGLDQGEPKYNHIRFFKNGSGLGPIVLRKGKRTGGEAFSGIESGTYYPAVSSYMGGTVHANFGPTFVYPPRKLPAGIKIAPLTDLNPPPLDPDAAVAKLANVIKLFRKPEQQQNLRAAIRAEATVMCQSYNNFLEEHLQQVRAQRLDRDLPVDDLPQPSVDAENSNINVN